MRHGGDQPPGVGVLRRFRISRRRPLLDDAAMLHHRDTVGDLRHHAEIVRDEQHAHAAARLDLPDQPQDLHLRRDVQRRGRLVRDQQGAAPAPAPSRSSRAAAGRPRGGRDGSARAPPGPAGSPRPAVPARAPRRAGPRHAPAAPPRSGRRRASAGSARSSAPGRSSPCRLPRSLRSRLRRRAPSGPCPSSAMRPARRGRPGGSRPITALAVIDLPEPDSPTTQRISPASTCSEMSSTACARSPPGGQRDGQALDARAALMPRRPALPRQPRVQRVRQPLPHQVQRQHGQEDGDAGEDAHPPGQPDHAAAGADQEAPGHQVRVAEPEEAQRRFQQDRRRHHQRGQHDDGRQRVGQDVRQHDAPAATCPAPPPPARIRASAATGTPPAPPARPAARRRRRWRRRPRPMRRREDRDQQDRQHEARDGLEELGEAHHRRRPRRRRDSRRRRRASRRPAAPPTVDTAPTSSEIARAMRDARGDVAAEAVGCPAACPISPGGMKGAADHVPGACRGRAAARVAAIAQHQQQDDRPDHRALVAREAPPEVLHAVSADFHARVDRPRRAGPSPG